MITRLSLSSFIALLIFAELLQHYASAYAALTSIINSL